MRHPGRLNAFDLGPTAEDFAPAAEPTEIAPRPSPPSHLSKEMRRWWREVVSEHALDGHRQHLLRLACESWDLANKAREALAEHGLTYTTVDGAPKSRPEAAIARDNRVIFARLVRDLQLDPPQQNKIDKRLSNTDWVPPSLR
jgi:P27 family predicted phage terminase small subunit